MGTTRTCRSFGPPYRFVRSRIGREVVHPGTILLREWMRPYNISQQELARALGVSPRRVNEIVQGNRAITADTAVRLSHKLGNLPHYWLGLQADYDIDRAIRRCPRRGRARRHEAFSRGRGWWRPITAEYRREKRREALLSLMDREDMEL